jgi:hypothetical protein
MCFGQIAAAEGCESHVAGGQAACPYYILIARLDENAVPFDIAEVTQPLPQGLQQRIGPHGRDAGIEPSNPVDFPPDSASAASGTKRRARDWRGVFCRINRPNPWTRFADTPHMAVVRQKSFRFQRVPQRFS